MTLFGCGATEMEEDRATPEAVNMEEGAAEPQEAESEAAYNEEYSKKDEGPSVNKWKDKAEQQLETMQDLLLILKEPGLDPAFEVEVKKELGLIYNNQDSIMNSLFTKKPDFTNFSELVIDNGDTMSLIFQNQAEIYKVKFLVKSELKDFGETSELVEKLNIISIQKEN